MSSQHGISYFSKSTRTGDLAVMIGNSFFDIFVIFLFLFD